MLPEWNMAKDPGRKDRMLTFCHRDVDQAPPMRRLRPAYRVGVATIMRFIREGVRFLVLLVASIQGNGASAAEAPVRDFSDLFQRACIAHPNDPDAVARWADTMGAQPVSNPKGLEVFTATPTGRAWWLRTADAASVVAIRTPPGLRRVHRSR
ncbi:hypothetical protein [Rhizosaccharibacter radicis]|uniref:Uncharacterized protein n=1 Tax=Rhizosaccharibacter radicis TaxID=2782605 RepID=A0ABT1VZM1_9PROT|nr:hypothetical protein [Acetobacteraceae bacterium KSS12]